jgi:hypothetical protein
MIQATLPPTKAIPFSLVLCVQIWSLITYWGTDIEAGMVHLKCVLSISREIETVGYM